MKKKRKSRLSFILLSALILYFSYIMIDQEKIFASQRNELGQLESKIKDEQLKNELLKDQHKSIRSDDFVEKLAREKLGMVKPGERVFVDMNK